MIYRIDFPTVWRRRFALWPRYYLDRVREFNERVRSGEIFWR